MPEPHQTRRRALAHELRGRELDVALVSDIVNVRYLTGFTGSNAALLLSVSGRATLATDGRYAEQAAVQCPDVERVISRTLGSALLETVSTQPTLRCGVETHVLTVDAHAALAEQANQHPGWVLSSLDRAVEGLREVKDADEIAALRRACAISTEALTGLLGGALAGRTELEIARDLEWRMYELGAEAIGFDTIVASGPNSAIPHHQPTGREVTTGDLLKLDFGARYAGYHADCTRTVVVGRAEEWQREVYTAVAASQQAGVDALAVDVPVAQVDAAARDSLDAAGYLEHFTTGLGHGVGLRIHEDPFVAGATSVDCGRAPRSPSSPASTCPAAAGYASRTRCWSPTRGRPCSPPPPRTCWSSTDPRPTHRARQRMSPRWRRPTT